MEKNEILKYLQLLNDKLQIKGIKGEVCLYGGAVMCLAFDARPSTKDIDAVFKPAIEIRKAAEEIAVQFDLRKDWLNDGVKGFLTQHQQVILFEKPFLTVYIPTPDYLLAMKTLAARVDTADKDDIILLIN